MQQSSDSQACCRFRVLAIMLCLWLLAVGLMSPPVLASPPKPSRSLLDEAPITVDPKDDSAPAIAYSDSADEYLVVWQYRYDDADSDIYGQRVNASGQHQGTKFAIATATKFEGAPAVAYSDSMDEYLVVWEHAVNDTDTDIYARRVSADGELRGAAFRIAILEGHEVTPDVAVSPSDGCFLVVWSGDANPQGAPQYNIYGQRVDKYGAKQGGAIAITQSPLFEITPAVAYSPQSSEYMVAWQQSVETTPPPAQTSRLASLYEADIYARRVTANGALAGSEIVVCDWEYDQVAPRLAYGAAQNEFLVVWEDHHWGWGADWDIYGRRIDANGTPDGAQFGISWDLSKARLSPDVAYKPGLDQFLVTWEYEYDAYDHDIYAQYVRSNGTLRGVEQGVCSTNARQNVSAVASDKRLGFMVVWEDDRNGPAGGARDIYRNTLECVAFEGYVKVPDQGNGSPLADVSVLLYCSNNEPDAGTLIDSTVTGQDGSFALYACEPCGYYNVVETDPAGYHSTAAETNGGFIVSHNWVQFPAPIDEMDLTGNVFWDDYDQTPTPESGPLSIPLIYK